MVVSDRGQRRRSDAWQVCGVVTVLGLLALSALPASSAHATPPTGNVMAATTPPAPQWVSHEVVPGERLSEIADRYAVSVASIARWNKLDPKSPRYWAGEKLRVQTQLPARQPEKIKYKIEKGDSWAKIAARFGVSQHDLQYRWNHNNETLQLKQPVVIWVERKEDAPEAPPPAAAIADATFTATAPSAAMPELAQSIGRPDHGRLIGGMPIPQNDALYTLRNLDHSYGSSHAINLLVKAVTNFRRDSGYTGELLIEDMSTENGGRFGPHHSHRTGRDVDIALPGLNATGRVDWDATWQLVHAFVATGEIRYIFLSRSRQVPLYKAAKRAGATSEELESIMQFPRHARMAIVRHAHGHTSHMHVRFACGAEETACQEI